MKKDKRKKGKTVMMQDNENKRINAGYEIIATFPVRCNELPHDSIVLAEQIRTLDKSRLVEYIGRASNNTMKRVDHAIDVIMKTKTKHNHYKRYNPNERR